MLKTEIGLTHQQAKRQVQQWADEVKDRPGQGARTDHITDRKPLTNSKKSKGGNMLDYLTARIKEVRPDILARMKAGEFTSVRAILTR